MTKKPTKIRTGLQNTDFFEGKKGLKKFFWKEKRGGDFFKRQGPFFSKKKKGPPNSFATRKSYSNFPKANFWVRKSFSRKKDDCQEFTRKNMTHTLTSFFHEYK